MKILLLTLTLLSSACVTVAPYTPDDDIIKNPSRTLSELCTAYQSAIRWSNGERQALMHKEIASRNVFSPKVMRGLTYGYKKTGYIGFPKNAMACRFSMHKESTSQSYGGLYEWYQVYGNYPILRIMFVDGFVASTYDY